MTMKKIGETLKSIYGWGILLVLFVGGMTSLGYFVAFCVDEKDAAIVCNFIYKGIFPYIIYSSSIVVLIGLLSMYLCGEFALSVKDSKK
jgi:hypothetical protein